MSMKGRFQVVSPDEIQCSLTITMPLGNWKELRETLSDKYPAWALGRMIEGMVSSANSQFTETAEFSP